MFQRSVLGNQLRVVTSMMAHTQSVSIAIFVGAGSRYETPELAGVSHFIEHLPFKGSEKWPTARHVSEAIEGVGGIMNASTDREVTVFWCKVARPHFRTALDVLLDMLMNPLLEPEEVEKEREVIQEELRMTYDNPSYRVDLLIDEALWPDQAMGRDVGGTPDTVAAIGQETIREYMTRQYNPANAVVAVAGNIQHDEVVSLLQNTTHNWRPQDALDWEPVSENGATGPVVKIERRRSDQSHLCLALPGLSLDDPDRYALSLLNVMLGDGMSSRLFLNLREEQGLAYDVSSSLNHFRDCGSLVVYCGVEPRKAPEAVQAVVSELAGMRAPAPAAELNKTREFTKGRLLLRMEDTRSVASWLGAQELLLGQVSTIDETVQLIDAVTAEDVARVAGRLLHQDKLRLAVVGPNDGEEELQKLLTL
jgi:predicted Zn-dependent peptidase